MTNCKKLLAIIVALVMLVSTLVSGLVVSAANPLGTLTVTGTTVDEGKDATVTFNLDLGENSVDALHMLVTIASDVAITDAEIGEVAYVSTEKFPAEDNELLDGTDPRLEISTKELAQGKLLFESGVATVAKVTDVEFTVTFATAELDAGDYDFNVTVDATDYDEADYDVITLESAITVCGAEEPKPDCDHADAVLEYEIVEDHCVTTKVCPCGEYEEVIADIAPTREGKGDIGLQIYKSPVLDAGLAIAFRTLIANTTDYTDLYGVFTKDMYNKDGTSEKIDPEVTTIPAADASGSYSGVRYEYLYEGIRSYEMCSNINVKIYGSNANGDVCLLGVLDYALANYIENNYAKSNGAIKTLLGDLAFYGAAAQDYFNYNLASKPNAGIENEHTALPTEFDTTDEKMEGGISISKSPDLANKVMIIFRFQPDDVASYGDNIRFEVDYKDAEGNDATFVKTKDEFETHDDGRHQIVFDKLVAARINTVVTAKVIAKVDGVDTVVGQLEYTLEKYAYNRYTGTGATGNGSPLCILTQALVNYGDAAAAYFG